MDTFIPLLFEDVRTVLLALIARAKEENVELPTDDMFAIYHKIKEALGLYRQIVRKYARPWEVVDNQGTENGSESIVWPCGRKVVGSDGCKDH